MARVNVSDRVSGRFEFGALNGVNLRILWGEWNFGAGSFGVVSTTAVIFSPLWDSGFSSFGQTKCRRDGLYVNECPL